MSCLLLLTMCAALLLGILNELGFNSGAMKIEIRFLTIS